MQSECLVLIHVPSNCSADNSDLFAVQVKFSTQSIESSTLEVSLTDINNPSLRSYRTVDT